MTNSTLGEVPVEQIAAWRRGLDALHARVGHRFARPEVRARAGRFLAALLARAVAAGVPAAWVTAGAVYGQDGGLRRWLEGEGRADVLAVTGSSRQWADTDDLIGRVPIARLAKVLPARRWRRLAVGAGMKGPRAFRWTAHAFPGGRAGWAK
jgi:hypothetical protein